MDEIRTRDWMSFGARAGAASRGGLLAVTMIASALACSPETPRVSPRPAPASTLDAEQPKVEVMVHGCGLIVRPSARRCLLSKPSVVSLWLPGRVEAGVSVRLDGAPIDAREIVDRDGLMLRVEPSSLRGVLELALDSDGQAAWSLELAPLSQDYEQLREASVELARDGEFERANELLDAGMAELDADEAALTRCLAAQLAYGSERMGPLLDGQADSHAVGCRGISHVLAAHAQLYESPDLNAAERNLAAAEADAGLDVWVHLNWLFHRADLDLLVGRIDESLATLDRVIRLAELVDEQDVIGSAQVMKAIALARLGRVTEAEQLADALADALDDADRSEGEDEVVVDIRYNLAWLALLRRELDAAAPDPTPMLENLVAVYAAREDPKAVARTRLHLALAAVQAGDLARAEAALALVEQAELAPLELTWLELVAGRAALGRGQSREARRHLARAQMFAELGEDPEQIWNVWITRAVLERAEGNEQAALAAYEQAAKLADRLALAVPGTAGRSMVVSVNSRVDAEHVELLLALGREAEALCVAVGARARHLRSLWARLRPSLDPAARHEYQTLLSRYGERRQMIDEQLAEAWSLSADELERLQLRLSSAGEQADDLLERATALLERDAPRWSCERILPREPTRALLTMSPDLEHGRWHFMLARGERPPRVLTLDADAPVDELARRAFSQLASVLAGVEILTVVPVAEFVAVDLHRHALEHPALAGLAVRYSLGLSGAGTPSPGLAREGAAHRAAVIAGAADLDAVEREAATVTRQLRARGWIVESSWSPTAADQPTLLHYAGHGQHVGLGGWRSSIEVPGFGRVDAAQLIAAQRAPNYVVLGACSTGSTDAEIIDGGMNFAVALLLAGAELVVAPSGPVDDAAALELAGALYRELSQPEELATALTQRQRAELDGHESGPRSALRWRVWTP